MNITLAGLKAAGVLAAACWITSAGAAPLSGGSPSSSGAFLAPEGGEYAAPPSERQSVAFPTRFALGTVVIDTAQTFLYYVIGNGQALRYSIGVGRDGFTWSGEQAVTRKAEWPDWTPPAEMIARQPYLPRWMAGGDGNPLGARAIYLGKTVYRIHGTNAPTTIGQRVSSGCIRMLNADVIDLYSRVDVGTKIVVLPGGNDAARIPAPFASAPTAAAQLSVGRSAVY
ncbi:MAG: L,D-transpeptidase [Candidatus Sulfotelmatobacter sp.]